MRNTFKLALIVVLILLCTGYSGAQETVNGGMVVLGPLRSNGSVAAVDFTAAGTTAPVKTGTLALRASTCVVGQMYFATDAPAGQNLYYCTSSGWVPGNRGGGGGNCQLASGLGFAMNGGDETALLNSTIAGMMSAGGGCLAIDPGKTIRADGQIVAPYGAGASIRITGSTMSGLSGPGDPVPVSVAGGMLDLRYHGSGVYGGGPKFLSLYFGTLQLDNLTITTNAGASDCAAFLMTTNTILYIRNVTFSGGKVAGGSCNDGIILGGTGPVTANDMTGYFNGYGTVIRDSRFANIARMAVLQSSANGIVIDSNYYQGGNITTPVPTVIDIPGGSINARMNQITNNLIELGNFDTGYNTHMASCAFRLGNAMNNSFRGNQVWDGDTSTFAFCNSDAARNKQNAIDKSNLVDSNGTRLTDSTWPANNYMPYRTIPFFFDGGGVPLSGTVTRCAPVSFGGQINQFVMAADQAGSGRIMVKTVGLGSYTGAASASDISNGGEFLSGASALQDSTLANWNTNLTPNSMVCFTLSTPAGLNWISGYIQVWEGK
jgi:hypothetical protein